MRAAIVLLLLTVLSCALPTRFPERAGTVSLVLHGDVSFTPRERRLVQAAVSTIEWQTDGLLSYSVVYDVDFEDTSSLGEHVGSSLLLRVDGRAPGVDFDDLGRCFVNFDDVTMREPVRVLLVWDRLEDDSAFVHVAMHELLHAARLQHVPEFDAVLSRTTPTFSALTCLRPSDAREICRVHGCEEKRIRTC